MAIKKPKIHETETAVEQIQRMTQAAVEQAALNLRHAAHVYSTSQRALAKKRRASTKNVTSRDVLELYRAALRFSAAITLREAER